MENEKRINENYVKSLLINNQEVKVLQYLPIKQKAVFTTYVTDSSFIENDDGIKVFDLIEKEISKTYCYIKLYTNYEFDESADLYDVYDQFKSTGDFESILDVIPDDEITSIEIMLDEMIESKKRENSDLSIIIEKFLNKLINKIPDSKDIQKIIKSLSKEFKNIDPKNIEMLKNIFAEQSKVVKK